MATPQSGIFVEDSTNHWFQEYDISRSADVAAVVAAIGSAAIGSVAAVNPEAVQDGIEIVIGVGRELANQIGIETALDFRPFETIGSGPRAAVATPHDLVLWIHGKDRGPIYDAALHARRTLTQVGAIVGDVPAFVYLDNRDLTGFIDGTENPDTAEARTLAVVAEGQQGEGGSTMLVQRWVHKLDAFHALDVADQERVIGRTKPDSVELEGDALLDTAHIARVVMEDDAGDEVEIYRRSVPWGDSTEAGLMFVGFSNELDKIDKMVQAMFGPLEGERADIHDSLTTFSTARTSSYFFAPSQEALAGLGQD